jgi:hypothetical protein
MSILGYVIWLLSPVCQIGILIFMLRRNLRKEFPFFFNYTIFQVISFAVLYTVYHFGTGMTYFYAYWTSSALGVSLGFLVIHEVFSYAIRPYAGLRDLGKVLFRWVAMLVILAGSLTAISVSGMNGHYLTQAVTEMERAVRLMQCGLLLFIFVCSSYLGLTWRNFAAGIALGYGIFAATQLVTYSVRLQVGGSWGATLSMISSLVYALSVLIWLGYSAMPEKAMQRVHNDVVYRPIFDRWNQAAMVLTAPMAPNEAAMSAGNHTYLTEIERAVDDIMAQQIPVTNNAHD